MLDKLKSLQKVNIVKLFRLEKYGKPAILVTSIFAFIFLNLLLAPFAVRLDLSRGQAYTLAPATKKILNNLDNVVDIKFFVSSGIPTRLVPLRTEIIDLLKEYEKQTNKIHLKILDPQKDEKAAAEAKQLGLPELQFSQLEQDKYAVSAAYFGVGVTYGSKKEIIPQVADTSSLEYNITSLIYTMTKKERAKIGIMGHEEIFPQQNDPLSTLRQILQQQFTIETVRITPEKKSIDQNLKALLLFDTGEKEYTEDEVKALQNYVKQKGNIIAFVDGVWVGENLQTTPAKHNLAKLFQDYGISINNRFILSTAAEAVNYGNEVVSLFVPYPFWVKADKFSSKSSLFSNVGQLLYPWVFSLHVDKKPGVEYEELVKTTSQSWEQKEPYTLNPQSIPQPQPKDLKEFVVTMMTKSKQGGKMIVIPSSRFVLNQYLSRTSGNIDFVINAMNDMATNGALNGIRQRTVNIYPLPELPASQKDVFKYLNILLLPGVFALFGAMWIMRRK